MFKMFKILMPLLMALSAHADDPSQEVGTDQLISAIFAFLGGLKGVSALGIVAGVIQLFMLFFETSLANFVGKWKLIIVLTLSFIGAIITQISQGMSITSALLSGATIASLQVLVNQIWKQFAVKTS